MINFSLNFWQVFSLLIVCVVVYKFSKLILSFITSSQWFIEWSIKRQQKIKKRINQNRAQNFIEQAKILQSFVKYINDTLKNSQKIKQFWRDFGTSPAQQAIWIKNFLNIIETEYKIRYTNTKEKTKE